LIVDDDLRFRRALHLALASYGYEVDEAASGKQALDSVAAHAPDAIVLDWHMPGMDGIQTCRALRAHSGVPVIMASANRSNLKDVALAAGANAYLAKPFSIRDLLKGVEAALNGPGPGSERAP
jgi:DNA-binding response OmpR family regulator